MDVNLIGTVDAYGVPEGSVCMQLTIDDICIEVSIDGRPYRDYGDPTDKYGQIKPHVEGYYGDIFGWRRVRCKQKIMRVRENQGADTIVRTL